MPRIDRTPRKGAPATIHLYTDTIAAVVTRVSNSTVWIRRVETGKRRTANAAEVKAGGLPVREEDGILDKPFGPEERYARHDDTGYHGRRGRGQIVVTIGRSVGRTDYRY